MIVVHDAEDPGSGPQTVTFSFNLDALAESVVARKLVENAAEYLMTASAATGVGPPPRSARLLPNVPNPFNPRTEIIFRTGLRGRVELDIYDTRGRRVACLVDAEELDAGEHSITWNGTDDRGRRVASGVYLVRLITGDQAAQRKVLLAR